MTYNNIQSEQAVIFYDGYCYLCSNSIRLLVWLDRKKKLRFMNFQKAMEDEYLGKLMKQHQAEKSIIMLYQNQIHTKSTAILNILKNLGGGFKLFGLFYFIPKGFRDMIYDFIAQNRYKFFGKRKQCHLPSSEFTDRFL